MKWMAFNGAVSFGVGLAAHQSRGAVQSFATEGWRSLVSYAVGTVCVIACGCLFYIHLPEIPNGRRYVLASLMSAFGVGAGVAAGWALDDWAGRS